MKVALAASSKTRNTSLIDLEHETEDNYRIDNTKILNSSSEAMCVESSSFADSIAFHGHRNGNVSIVDYRSRSKPHICSGCDKDGGFVSNIYIPCSQNFSFACRSSWGKK